MSYLATQQLQHYKNIYYKNFILFKKQVFMKFLCYKITVLIYLQYLLMPSRGVATMQAGEASASLKIWCGELKLQLKGQLWTCWMHRALEISDPNAFPYISNSFGISRKHKNWVFKNRNTLIEQSLQQTIPKSTSPIKILATLQPSDKHNS